MFVAVGLQIAAVSVLTLVAWLFWGGFQAGSLLLGGLAAIIPNALFAMRLALNRGRAPETYPVVFFLGEFIKIGLTIALLAAMFRWAGPQHWGLLIAGLIVALKMPLFGLWILGDKTRVVAGRTGAGQT